MFINAKVSLAFWLFVMVSQSVHADARTQSKQIHDRLTGIPPTQTVLNEMVTALAVDSSGRTAADIALQNDAFYNVTLKNFSAPWTNEAQTVFTPLNDYSATIIGMVRDEVDFRQVLYGDILYRGHTSLAISSYSISNNNHYQELEALGPVTGNLADSDILVRQTQSEVTGFPPYSTAGVVTSRASARAFFLKGTNRSMFRFTFLNHLCTDLEQIKDNTRSPDRVRQDASRSPGGDSRIYMNSCVGCHAGMDGLLGAQAYYDLQFNEDSNGNLIEDSAQMVYTPNSVQAKYLINENNFQPGFITIDDSWVNYWREGQNALLGWNDGYPGFQQDVNGHVTGNGAKSMGMELAYSDAFAQCQVKKAFKAVCLRDPDDYAADRGEVNNIVADFINGYNMKNVFRDVAAWCKGS